MARLTEHYVQLKKYLVQHHESTKGKLAVQAEDLADTEAELDEKEEVLAVAAAALRAALPPMHRLLAGTATAGPLLAGLEDAHHQIQASMARDAPQA